MAAEIVERVRMWTESHKICQVSALINQILPWCFRFSGLWLTSQIIERVNISESIDINQSILSNGRAEFHPGFFCLPIIQHDLIISTHVRRVCHSNK